MAHGNVSDLAFLGMLLIALQWLFLPDTLFQDLGPLKAQFSGKPADMDAALKLGAGLILTLGAAFSSVKWNPINGKMGGPMGLITVGTTAYFSMQRDGNAFVPRLFYVYLAVLFVGSVHITLFPSNPLVKTVDPKAKNNHGNMSDFVALWLLVAAGTCLFYPDHLFMELGPLRAQFRAKSEDVSFLIRFVACVEFMWALLLSGVKWNPINGKVAGIGAFICSGLVVHSNLKADGFAFVPSIFYLHALLIFLSALHIFAFPSNPLPPKAGKAGKPGKKE